MDGLSSPIKLFDRTGKFIATRGRIGRGPNEFVFLQGFAVDYETESLCLYVSDGASAYLFAYDPMGKFSTSISLGLSGGSDFVYYEDQLVQLQPSWIRPYWQSFIGTNVPLLYIYSPDLQHKETLEAIDKGPGDVISVSRAPSGAPIPGDLLRSRNILSGNGKTLMVRQARNDTVMYYRGGGLEPAYLLNFGGYTIPAEAFGMNAPVPAGDSYGISNMYEGDRYVFIGAHGNKNNVDVQLVFDRRNPAKGFSALGPDGTTGLFLGGIKFTPMYVRDNRLVGYVQAFDIVDNVAAITDPELKALAATLREDSNPVIVVATLKK
jgi:hypothetical protein